MFFFFVFKSFGLWKIDGEVLVIGEEYVILSIE